MEDKIVRTVIEQGEMTVILKSGKKIPVKATTEETYWKSGRKDCNVTIHEPIITENMVNKEN